MKCASVIFAYRRVILLRSDIWNKVQVIFALRVFRANIIKLKLQVSISLCRKAKYHCETYLTISLITFSKTLSNRECLFN